MKFFDKVLPWAALAAFIGLLGVIALSAAGVIH